MDWMHVLTIISAMIAAIYVLHSFLRSDIKEFKQEMRDDMRTLEDRFDRRMEMYESDRRYTNEMIRNMDAKWERLFERFAIQDSKFEKLTEQLSIMGSKNA
jgi:hypothetical protein